MKKYFIDSGHAITGKNAWVIAEVEVDEKRKYGRDLMSGKYVESIASDFYTGRVGSVTGARHKWRFQDELWKCQVLLILMLFHDDISPSGDEPWLKKYM